jgi:chemotaxis signal transduction protein
VSGNGLIRCVVGTREYALRADDVRHVTRADQLRAATVDDGRAGELKLAGQLVPVFSLGAALGIDDSPRHPDQHIAITGDPPELVGWLADRVERAGTDDETDIAPLPRVAGGRASGWFHGVVTLADSHRVLLIDPRRLHPLHPSEPPASESSEEVWSTAQTAAPTGDPMTLVFSTPVLPQCEARRFALSGRQVVAIVQPVDSIELPGAAPHVTGLTLWRDVLVPILDYREADLRTADAGRRQLIAQTGANGARGLVCFSIDPEVVMHRPATTDRLLPDLQCPAFAAGVFDVGGEPVALLNLDALLAD